ncbi:hypothetical protein AB0K40_17880 [Nonomuraea bangladeshensis]|uniref:Uncharacterized protein n=1 Tax=Nonomuraea bangladeshensis TaxID=404385 RepID=A0ABV3H4C3_9ACTN
MAEQPPFGSPEWAQQLRQFQEGFERASRQLGEALGQTQRIFAAQAAMGWAYRGDIDGTRTALKRISPEQLRELSAAASMLAALADEELSSR